MTTRPPEQWVPVMGTNLGDWEELRAFVRGKQVETIAEAFPRPHGSDNAIITWFTDGTGFALIHFEGKVWSEHTAEDDRIEIWTVLGRKDVTP